MKTEWRREEKEPTQQPSTHRRGSWSEKTDGDVKVETANSIYSAARARERAEGSGNTEIRAQRGRN